MPRLVAFKAPDDLYEELKRRSLESGYTLVSDYVRDLVASCVRGEGLPQLRGLGDVRRLVESLVRDAVREVSEERVLSRIERRVQDMLNPWTAKIDGVASRLATVIERLEALEDRISKLEEKLRELEERVAEQHAAPAQPPARARRRSAIERLREQGIVFESDVQWLRDRDAFFERLRREGALILNVGGERVAVDKGFWENFVDKVEKLPTPNDEEVRVLLTEPQYRLFRKLKESGMIYFDSTERRWKFVERPA